MSDSIHVDHVHPPAAAGRQPRFSLLRLSAAARAGLALIVIAALWAGVWWALH